MRYTSLSRKCFKDRDPVVLFESKNVALIRA